MATRFFLRDTQTESGTGGTVYDLLVAQGTPATLGSGNEGGTAFVEKLRFQRTVDNTVAGTSFPISIDMASVSASTLEWRYRVQQLDSANAVKASSAYDGPYNTAGIKTATLTLSGTWVTGDRLAVSLELRKVSGGGNRSFTLNVNDIDSYIDATLAASVTLAAISAGVGTVSGALAVARPLAAASAGLSTVAGVLAVARPLVAASVGVSTVASAMAVAHPLAAAPAGISTVAAALTVTLSGVTLAAVSNGVATITGVLAVARSLSAISAGTGTVTAAVRLQAVLQASSNGVVTVAGALSLSLVLVGTSTAAGTIIAALTVSLLTYTLYGAIIEIDTTKFYDGALFFFEATMKVSNGVGFCRLYNITDGGPVTNSDISTGSTDMVRVRSAQLALTGTEEYQAQIGGNAGQTITCRIARIVVEV